MIRAGVHFDQITPGHRNILDRFLFKKMREEAQRKRHMRGVLYRTLDTRGHERRFARRIRIEDDDKVRIWILSEAEDRQLARDAQARLLSDPDLEQEMPKGTLKIFDLSTTGCAYLCLPPQAPKPGSIISLQILDEEFIIQATAHVIYAAEHR